MSQLWRLWAAMVVTTIHYSPMVLAAAFSAVTSFAFAVPSSTPSTASAPSSLTQSMESTLAATPSQYQPTTRTNDTDNSSNSNDDTGRPLCMYRSPATRNRWTRRMELSDLCLGQELQAVVVQAKLQNVTTGPKVWVDVGVGRYMDKQQKWKMVFGMLRLGRKNSKKDSVVRKKVSKLRSKEYGFTVVVSRIRLAQDQFEVVLQQDVTETGVDLQPSKLKSTSLLQPGDEILGMVRHLHDYGCIIDVVGYNRPGLLHIQRVADLYGRYIDKTTGLQEAGLELRTNVRLQVVSNVKKRLFLDFTNDVKEDAERERQEQIQPPSLGPSTESNASVAVSSEMSADEVAEWEAYYSNNAAHEENDDESLEDDDDDDDRDDYDEERDIEDALGLGSY